MRVLFITNIPSPYRVLFFNELGKQCDLTVCYERKSAGDRDIRWVGEAATNYTVHFTSDRKIGADKSIGLGLIQEIKNASFDHLIITGYASPSVMLAIIYCRAHRISYMIESDGGFNHIDHGIKRCVKKFLLRGAYAFFTTCEEYSSYLLSIGIVKEKIYKYPFTSLYEKDIAVSVATNSEKKQLRTELGITEKKVVLSVGQFIPRKGFDVLLDAAHHFSDEIGTYIIGGVPGYTYISQKERLGLKHVHFVDFKQKEELKKWYRAADVFVLPTREDIWGLVINEAMANGLPVITTTKCIAGLEMVDNSNGAIVPVGSVDRINDEIMRIFSDEENKNLMAKRSIEKIHQYTIENMVEAHMRVIEALESRQ